MSTADKVRQIISLPAEEISAPVTVARSAAGFASRATEPRRPKLTTRILPEQLDWIHHELARFREEFPRAPRLTVAELVQIALEELRESKNIDYLVTKFRS